jgi:hypothetical protein
MSLATIQHMGHAVRNGLRVLTLAIAGLLLREIADRLGLSRQTLQLLAGVFLAYAACRLWLRGSNRCKACSC